MSGCRIFLGGLSNRATEGDVERFFDGFGKIREVNLKQGYGFVEFDDHRDADDAVYEMNNQTLAGSRVTVEHAKGTPRRGGGGGGGGSFGGGRRDNYGGGGGGGYGGRDRGGYGGRDRGGGGYGDRYGRDDRGGGGRSFGGRYAPPSRTKYRVIVENLSSRVTWQDLKDYLRGAGGEVTYAEANQKTRNEGVVDFASYDDMKNAISKLDDTELCGRKIRLYEEKRSPSRSRSRSPIRSRSRDRSRRDSNRSRSPSPRHSRSPDPAEKSRDMSKSPDRSRSYSKSPVRD
uniref:Serine/arginine-rich splicing factor 5 n=3 Tax=Phallusia mammillata TaxID=59560 RepID=A0A6F9DUE5_9ASCI|nr:serine/arginine-rich splicing factor 5 [Phallusia mammillata]